MVDTKLHPTVCADSASARNNDAVLIDIGLSATHHLLNQRANIIAIQVLQGIADLTLLDECSLSDSNQAPILIVRAPTGVLMGRYLLLRVSPVVCACLQWQVGQAGFEERTLPPGERLGGVQGWPGGATHPQPPHPPPCLTHPQRTSLA